jgi:threonine synthase
MPFSTLSHLECSRDRSRHDADIVQGTSPLGAPLLARYDLDQVSGAVTPADIARRAPDLWRYHELLPVRDPANVVTLGEGMTPLLPLPRHGARLGVPRLRIKDEGLVPTGAFKARGAAVGISRAVELGVRGIAMPTNGNAELYLVDGLIGDAGKLVAQAVRTREGYQDTSTLKEPYRIEGKKTMGYEIVEQLGWRCPDVILYPTGGGVGIIAIHKALLELSQLGWITGDLPRLVAVQAAGCAPIVDAFHAGLPESTAAENPQTIAFGITVPKALGDFLVLDAVRATGGTAIAVTDDELLAAQTALARDEGIWVCPEGAACFAAVGRLRESGWVSADEDVVVLNTGTGLIYPDTVPADVPTIAATGRIPAR